ncbi:MAG: LapA family protein [Rhodothermales bacterium]
MRITLVISLLIAVLAVVFALQNPDPINVNLGPFDVTGSTALILMITFSLGVVVGILAALPTMVKRKNRIRHLEKSATSESLSGDAPKSSHASDPKSTDPKPWKPD